MCASGLNFEATEHADDVTRRLSVELRKHIRALAAYEITSPEWFVMVESLQHIASIALMEQQVPEKGSTETTLWDRDELVVRFLLEEGKLNMCLRALVNFVELKKEMRARPDTLQIRCQRQGLDTNQVMGKLNMFEYSMGLLLKCALNAVEALQTCDVPLLLQMCADILSFSASSPTKPGSGDMERSQETLVLYYLLSVSKRLTNLNEERVMDIISQLSIVPSVIAHLLTHHSRLRNESLMVGLEFLNYIIDTDTFDTHQDRFFSGDSQRQLTVSLYDSVLQPMTNNPDLSKRIPHLIRFAQSEKSSLQ